MELFWLDIKLIGLWSVVWLLMIIAIVRISDNKPKQRQKIKQKKD